MTLIYIHEGCAVTKLSTVSAWETACGDFVCGDMALARIDQVECDYCKPVLEDLLGEPFYSDTSESFLDFVLRAATIGSPEPEREPEPEPEPEPSAPSSESDDYTARFALLELD